MHRAHLVSLDRKSPIFLRRIHQAAHRLEVGFRLDQRQRGKDDFLAGIGQHHCHLEPIVESHLVAPRADRLAQIDDIDGLLGHLGIEIHGALTRPVEQQRAQGKFHQTHFHGRL